MPKRTAKAHDVKDCLALGDRFPPPVRVETVTVPHPGKPPKPFKIKYHPRSDFVLPAPRLHVIFRPEEQHRRSREADIAPPVAGLNGKVHDAGSLGQSTVGDDNTEWLPRIRTGG